MVYIEYLNRKSIMGAMCSQSAEAPVALDKRMKQIYFNGKNPTEAHKFVPKISYLEFDPKAEESIKKEASMPNPYDFKDELFEVFLARERQE
jgi:hypothetical protein